MIPTTTTRAHLEYLRQAYHEHIFRCADQCDRGLAGHGHDRTWFTSCCDHADCAADTSSWVNDKELVRAVLACSPNLTHGAWMARHVTSSDFERTAAKGALYADIMVMLGHGLELGFNALGSLPPRTG
jgi:hypothetical protein